MSSKIRNAFGIPLALARAVTAVTLLLTTAAVAASGVVFVADRNEIPGVVSRAGLDGTNGYAINLGATSASATFIALDVAGGRMYMTNHAGPWISAAYLDGSGGVNLGDLGGNLVAGLSDPYGIALDVVSRKMYVAVRGSNVVLKSNLDGTGTVVLSLGGLLNNPYGIAVDPAGGRIYVANTSGNEIIRATLDGLSPTSLTLGGLLVSPAGVALDVAAGKMYVTSLGNGTIVKANLDGSSPASIGNFGGLLTAPLGLALDLVAGKIYATQYAVNSLFQANLDGSGGVNLGNLKGTLNLPVGVAVMPVLPFNCSLDIDGNGNIDALTDGLMLLRAMFGLTGTSVTNAAIGQGATRQDWAAIRGYTNTNCGSGFVQ